ncbi:hypothetical protein MKW92_050441 [Papaver armeniacum]|nr:hypothetical protein MKW92_050441 [Papaver armeniacum]
MRTCVDKPMTHETQDGDSLYVDHQGILEIVCSDDDKEEKHRESSLEILPVRVKIQLGSAKKTQQGSHIAEVEKLATMVNGDKDVEGMDGVDNASQVEVQDNNDPVDKGWKIAKEKMSSANKNIVEDDDRVLKEASCNINQFNLLNLDSEMGNMENEIEETNGETNGEANTSVTGTKEDDNEQSSGDEVETSSEEEIRAVKLRSLEDLPRRKIMTSFQNVEALMKFSNLMGIAGVREQNV